jgi:C4-dicarboxylate-specific signal transduction histidine kinase
MGANVLANLDVDYTRHLIRSLFAFCRHVAHSDGQLTVSTNSCNGEVDLTFLAEGPSVQPDLLQNLFEPLNQSMSDGLSLANVRRIVEANAGRLAASAGAHTVSVVVTFPAA